MTVERFLIKIFMGRDELARAVFHVGPLSQLGFVEYSGSDHPELDAIMGTIVRRRLWTWPALTGALRQSLTMSTGGRYVLRFHETPVSDGRGDDDVLRKCFRERASV